jgi:hypothetical protein
MRGIRRRLRGADVLGLGQRANANQDCSKALIVGPSCGGRIRELAPRRAEQRSRADPGPAHEVLLYGIVIQAPAHSPYRS